MWHRVPTLRLLQAVADVRDSARLPAALRRRASRPRHASPDSAAAPARSAAHRPVLPPSRQGVRLQQDHVVRRDLQRTTAERLRWSHGLPGHASLVTHHGRLETRTFRLSATRFLARDVICTSRAYATMSASVCLSVCPSVCDGSALAHYS